MLRAAIVALPDVVAVPEAFSAYSGICQHAGSAKKLLSLFSMKVFRTFNPEQDLAAMAERVPGVSLRPLVEGT